MKVPTTFVSDDKDLKKKLEELLDGDKINVILLGSEEKRIAAVYCEKNDGDVLLEFDDGNPSRILGCRLYEEDKGHCYAYGGSCKYLKWKVLKPLKV